MLDGLLPTSGLPVLFIALGFIAAAALVVLMLVMLKYKKQRDHINRRILPMAGEVTAQNAAYILYKQHENEEASGFSLSIARLDLLIVQAGKKINSSRFLFMMGAASIGILATSVALGLSVAMALPLALVLGGGGPIFALRFLKKRRVKKFSAQFSEAIELIVRSLKAGHPVPTAIRMVSREMADPIGTEFGLISDEVSYGSDLVSAIKGMQKRIAYDDLSLFVTAISIQSITGGNLSVILEGLATVLRQRVKLKRKVKAAAAEGRASALILNSVPIAVMAFITIFSPDYYGSIIHEEFIITGLIGAFGWMMIGNFAMYKMMHFKV
jgi:tight adherence protein B